MEEESKRLLRLLAQARQRRPGDRQVEAMLSALINKMTLAYLNLDGDARPADAAGQPGLDDRYGLN